MTQSGTFLNKLIDTNHAICTPRLGETTLIPVQNPQFLGTETIYKVG